VPERQDERLVLFRRQLADRRRGVVGVPRDVPHVEADTPVETRLLERRERALAPGTEAEPPALAVVGPPLLDEDVVVVEGDDEAVDRPGTAR
jgi:hypothetical protein